MGISNFDSVMRLAMIEGAKAVGEVPVGAVLLDEGGNILAKAGNRCVFASDPLAHAEIEVIRAVVRAKPASDVFSGATLVVNLEPCLMCAAAMRHAKIGRVVFGAWNTQTGAAGSVFDLLRDPKLGRPVEVLSGVLADECSAQIDAFFESLRIR